MGCDAKRQTVSGGNAVSCSPIQHPLHHQAIGGVKIWVSRNAASA